MARAPLTVVVPTRDRPEMLAACLAALRADLAPTDQLVVVDSASVAADAVAEVVATAGAQLVRCDVRGASRARNAGWRAAVHDEVAFVDDDVRVLAGWSEAFVGRTDDRVGFVVGRTLAPEGYVGEPASVTHGRPPDVLDGTTVGRFAASNNLLLRRSALEACGGFDERLGPGTWFEAGEDLEMLDRVIATGLVGHYAHDAAVVHEQWRAPGERLRLQWSYGKGMGARTAAAARRRPGDGWRLLPEVLRIKGLLTLGRRLTRRSAPTDVEAGPGASQTSDDASGWAGPVVWRGGALVGLVVGLVRLKPRRGGVLVP
jgi:GT2 family glycosyltransferase